MEENKFKCSGDCLNCRKQPNERREQWLYCASQFTYNSMRMIEEMKGVIKELSDKVEALQNNEADVFAAHSPSETPVEQPIAQEGVGAIE